MKRVTVTTALLIATILVGCSEGNTNGMKNGSNISTETNVSNDPDNVATIQDLVDLSHDIYEAAASDTSALPDYHLELIPIDRNLDIEAYGYRLRSFKVTHSLSDPNEKVVFVECYGSRVASAQEERTIMIHYYDASGKRLVSEEINLPVITDEELTVYKEKLLARKESIGRDINDTFGDDRILVNLRGIPDLSYKDVRYVAISDQHDMPVEVRFNE